MSNPHPENSSNKHIKPEFTIIICTYNQAESLKNTLASINASKDVSTTDIELLVIINNSSDNTEEICQNFSGASIFPFKYIIEKEQGLSHARNRGIRESTGKILIFTDDDVVVPDNWLNSIIATYNNEEPDCVFGKVIPEWKDNKPEWFSQPMSTAYALLDYGNEKLDIKTNGREFFGANFSIKKYILVDIGGFNVELGRKGEKLFIGEETQIFRHLVRNRYRIIYNPDNYLFHVIHESRKTKAFIRRYFRDIADSNFYMSNKNSIRNLFGIPLYKYKDFFLFYISFIPEYLWYSITLQHNRKFLLLLNLIKNNRLLYLYIQNMVSRGSLAAEGKA